MVSTLVFLLLMTSPVAAQQTGQMGPNQTETLEPIIVTASREPRPLQLSPASTYVVSRAEIERKRYSTVLEALREIPGVHVDQPGGRGSVSSVYLRGLDPNHTLVLIDGVRVNDATNNRGGSFDLSTLGVENVERLEVVRGPLSAVYGSDAIAGAINVVTKRGGETDELELDVSGGRFGYIRAMGGAWGRKGPVDYSFTASYIDEGDLPNDSAYSDWKTKAAIGVRLPGDAELLGTLRFIEARAKAFPSDSGGPEFAVIRELENRTIQEFTTKVELTQEPIERLTYSLLANYYRRRESRDSPGIAPGVRDPFGIPAESGRDVLSRYAVALRATARVWYDIGLTLGGDFYQENGSSRSGLLFNGFPVSASFDLDRSVGGPFAEVFWACTCGLVFQASVRADFPSDTSSKITPRVSASYHVPRTGAVLSVNWGEGFKLPSFFSLANPIVGNPNLRAETSRGFDAGIRLGLWNERLTTSVTYFDITVRDLIDFEPGPPPRLVNRSKVVSRGVEVGIQAKPLDSLIFKGHLTYNEVDIRGSSDQLLNRPRWKGGFSFSWEPLEDLELSMQALFVGAVRDSSVPTGEVTLNSYQRFDMALSWRVLRSATLYLAIDNATNASYEEAEGFPAVGIRPRIGLNMKM